INMQQPPTANSQSESNKPTSTSTTNKLANYTANSTSSSSSSIHVGQSGKSNTYGHQSTNGSHPKSDALVSSPPQQSWNQKTGDQQRTAPANKPTPPPPEEHQQRSRPVANV